MLKFKSFLLEGGNVQVKDLQGKIQSATKLDLKKIKRSDVKVRFLELFIKLNQLFKKHSGNLIWKDEKLIHSGHVFNGSSEAFFQSHISDEEYVSVKKTVGDIDVTVPHDIKKELWEFLNTIQGHKITPTITYVGNNRGVYKDTITQINAIFNYKEGAVDLNLQIDFELLPYDANHAPTDFAKFSHSSDWKDLKAGIKGLHHKFLLRALTGGMSLRKDVQVVTAKTGRPQSNPDGVTFNKFSVDKGLRANAYVPVLDDAGAHKQVNGLPAYHEIPSAKSTYLTNVNDIAKHMFGADVSDSEVKQNMSSFVGVISLMKKYCTKDQIQMTLDRMVDIYWGQGAQGIERDDPEADLQIKTAGWNMLEKEFPWYKRADMESMLKHYYANYTNVSISECNMLSFDEFLVESGIRTDKMEKARFKVGDDVHVRMNDYTTAKGIIDRVGDFGYHVKFAEGKPASFHLPSHVHADYDEADKASPRVRLEKPEK